MPVFSETPSGSQVILFAVHPLHNPIRLHEVYHPIMDVLNAHAKEHGVDVVFRLESSRSYAEFEKKLKAGSFEFALPNPYQALMALDFGYEVFGKMGEDEKFRGILLVRKDRQIMAPQALRGEKISFPAPTALAATMLPMHFLAGAGLFPKVDYEPVFAGSQESSIMQVYLGHTMAGATWPPPWELFKQNEPEKASQLEVKWETKPLINNALIVREDVPEAIRKIMREVFFTLHQKPNGKALLAPVAISYFEPATNATYTKVREFLEEYKRLGLAP